MEKGIESWDDLGNPKELRVLQEVRKTASAFTPVSQSTNIHSILVLCQAYLYRAFVAAYITKARQW